MIPIARLTIQYANQKEDREMGQVLTSHMEKCGVKKEEIWLNGKDNQSSTHYGNWVLTPCLNNDALKKLAESMGTKIDFQDYILEQSDIEHLKIKDRVKVRFYSSWASLVQSEGRVYQIRKMPSGTEITIIQKGKRSKGWRFIPGDRVLIEKI